MTLSRGLLCCVSFRVPLRHSVQKLQI